MCVCVYEGGEEGEYVSMGEVSVCEEVDVWREVNASVGGVSVSVGGGECVGPVVRTYVCVCVSAGRG